MVYISSNSLNSRRFQATSPLDYPVPTKNIFPVIPWRVWTLPKTSGGLGVIDIQIQASALYFRWL
jgi:hypothetical protein